jgi:TonB family protein
MKPRVVLISALLGACSAAGTTTRPPAPAPQDRFVAVTAGASHTCALTNRGSAVCWGANRIGELGAGFTGGSSATPLRVAGDSRFTALSAGREQTCATSENGDGYCWGIVNLPIPPGRSAVLPGDSVPSHVASNLRLSAIAVGQDHACGLTTAGAAWCWGQNGAGQLGGGPPTEGGPIAVSGGLTFTHVSAANAYSCGVTAQGDAYCWGLGYPGQLVNGTMLRRPTAIRGNQKFVTVSAGWDLTCGLTAEGKAYCWGPDSLRRSGNVNVGGIAAPVPMPAGVSFASISVGLLYACASASDGSAYCWRDARFNRLAGVSILSSESYKNRPGRDDDGHETPVRVAGDQRFTMVSAGTYHACGVTTGGAVYCWGDNQDGHLGDGTTNASATPVRVREPGDAGRLRASVARVTQAAAYVPGQVYFDFQVDRPVRPAPGVALPVFPDSLKRLGIGGDVIVQFVVDTNGLADIASLKVVKSPHAALTDAVRGAVPEMRYLPAEIGGKKVKQLVSQPFSFGVPAPDPATISWTEQDPLADCSTRQTGAVCLRFPDDYRWIVEDVVLGWDDVGEYQGKPVTVAHGRRADYYHVNGTRRVATIARR